MQSLKFFFGWMAAMGMIAGMVFFLIATVACIGVVFANGESPAYLLIPVSLFFVQWAFCAIALRIMDWSSK